MDDRVKVVATSIDHIKDMAPRVRDADRWEIWAACHLSPLEALISSVESVRVHASETWTTFLDGKIVAIFGMVDLDESGKNGALWLIGTDDIYENAKLFYEHSEKWLKHYRRKYDYIMNWVDARNVASVNWIKKVGFTVNEAVSYGPDGMPFHLFEWRRDNV